ncbi:helix-turn-helix domain-containing protein, partial [bacterium]|nr:helix-turn-helix domain-containing protein [bacterium]
MTQNEDHNQITDLKSIGRILKKKREEHTYTLEHVSEITRITLTSLRNIEDGNLSDLPGLVFVRGFIRNYAKLLGLE